jgi:Outer membrane protein beta-barrel domain
MRYLILSVLFLLSGYYATAQISFAPEAGIGMSSMHFAPQTEPIPYTSASTQALASAKIGVAMDVPMHDNREKLYFQSGLFLAGKGQTRTFSYHYSDTFNDRVHQTVTLNYLDLPFNVCYKTKAPGFNRIIFGIGVDFSYLLFGKNKIDDKGVYNDTAYGYNANRAIQVGTDFRGFDIGINFLAGYELASGLFLRAYYTASFTDIGLDTEIDKNRIWGISAGLYLHKKKDKEAEQLIEK